MMKCLNPKLATCFKKKAKRSNSRTLTKQKADTVLTQTKNTCVNKNWVILDSQFAIDVFITHPYSPISR